MGIRPGAEPFAADGGGVGVMLGPGSAAARTTIPAGS